MKNIRYIFITIFVLLFIGLGILFYFIFSSENQKVTIENIEGTGKTNQEEPKLKEKLPCNSTKKDFIVNGLSMQPLIKDKTELTYYEGYYDCMDVSNGDIVIYNHGNQRKIIKQVKALPGDSFKYENLNIIINGEVLKNSKGEKYEVRSNMLQLYAKNYDKLPENSYLILGDNNNGSLDSTKFGFVSSKDFLGKVIIK